MLYIPETSCGDNVANLLVWAELLLFAVGLLWIITALLS